MNCLTATSLLSVARTTVWFKTATRFQLLKTDERIEKKTEFKSNGNERSEQVAKHEGGERKSSTMPQTLLCFRNYAHIVGNVFGNLFMRFIESNLWSFFSLRQFLSFIWISRLSPSSFIRWIFAKFATRKSTTKWQNSHTRRCHTEHQWLWLRIEKQQQWRRQRPTKPNWCFRNGKSLKLIKSIRCQSLTATPNLLTRTFVETTFLFNVRNF